MIKGSLASFADDMRDAHVQATLETIQYAGSETHWEIIAHDFLANSAFMFGTSCWAAKLQYPFHAGGDNNRKCLIYQNGDFRALKYELEYSLLISASVTEMLRLKSDALECRVASLWPGTTRMQYLLKHHISRWKRNRAVGTTVSSGSAKRVFSTGSSGCKVEPIKDTLLGRALDAKFDSNCLTQANTTTSKNTCERVWRDKLKQCRTVYTKRIDAQLSELDRQYNAFNKFVQNVGRQVVSIHQSGKCSL